ncbi:hypothetical protein, partial [Roseisolibacter sp. H3M3-2]|uniref:hypothetical protein n=1 Tax=Roseisolibacter sp. H3M3-2 TaxID=3031323 RepID=UPI0023DAF68A
TTWLRSDLPRLGFAADARRPALRLHPCAHVADAVLAVAALRSPRQAALNAVAVATVVGALAGAPDLHAIVRPPAAPLAVAPFSTSPYALWVSLDTRHPEDFAVVLESGFWANRRAAVASPGGAAPPRAELRLRRLSHRASTRDVDDGTVWVERRPRFLGREFAGGERVGRYSLPYLVRLP